MFPGNAPHRSAAPHGYGTIVRGGTVQYDTVRYNTAQWGFPEGLPTYVRIPFNANVKPKSSQSQEEVKPELSQDQDQIKPTSSRPLSHAGTPWGID